MTQAAAHSWNVTRTSPACRACGSPIAPGQTCWAALVEGLPAEPDAKPLPPLPYARVDFCDPCWSANHRPEAPLTLFSFWKTTIPIPQQKKKLLVDDSVLIELFTRLADKTQPQDLQFRFVLALILMRKRLLKYEGMLDPQPNTPPQEIWIMTPRGALDSVHVLNPQLTPEQIADLSTQLSTILAEEL